MERQSPLTQNVVPEPQAKRKTLAERAGEPLNPLRSHMPQPAKVSLAKSVDTLARPASNTGTLSMNGYRSTSNTSTTSTASGGSVRPASRLNGSRVVGGRPPSVADSRSGMEEVEPDAGLMGKRKGTPILSFQPLNGIALRKTRAQSDLRSQPSADMSSRSQHSGFYMRNSSSNGGGNGNTGHNLQRSSQEDATHGPQSRSSSLVNAFAELSLTPRHCKTSGPKSSTKHRPSLSPVKETTSPSKIPKFSCTPSLRHTQSSQALFSTPSPLKQKSSVNGLRTPTTSTARRGTAKDDIPVFLTKEKLTPLPAWDTKGRLEDMEQLYSQLRSQFASAADSKSALEETLSLYKSQGRLFSSRFCATLEY
jgi:kinesin family protein C1